MYDKKMCDNYSWRQGPKENFPKGLIIPKI